MNPRNTPQYYDEPPRAVRRREMVRKLIAGGMVRVTAIKRAKELIK